MITDRGKLIQYINIKTKTEEFAIPYDTSFQTYGGSMYIMDGDRRVCVRDVVKVSLVLGRVSLSGDGVELRFPATMESNAD